MATLEAGKEFKQTDMLQQSTLLASLSLNPNMRPQGQEDYFSASCISLMWVQA